MPFSPWVRPLFFYFHIKAPLSMGGVTTLPSAVWWHLTALPVVSLRCHRNCANHRRRPSYIHLTHHHSTLVPRITKLRSVVCLRPSVSVVVYRGYPINVERDTQASIFLCNHIILDSDFCPPDSWPLIESRVKGDKWTYTWQDGFRI